MIEPDTQYVTIQKLWGTSTRVWSIYARLFLALPFPPAGFE